jgi:hypothetical protein
MFRIGTVLLLTTFLTCALALAVDKEPVKVVTGLRDCTGLSFALGSGEVCFVVQSTGEKEISVDAAVGLDFSTQLSGVGVSKKTQLFVNLTMPEASTNEDIKRAIEKEVKSLSKNAKYVVSQLASKHKLEADVKQEELKDVRFLTLKGKKNEEVRVWLSKHVEWDKVLLLKGDKK